MLKYKLGQFILFLALLTLATLLRANSPEVDSLRKALLTQQGEARAHTLYQLGQALGPQDLDQSLTHLQNALALAQQSNDQAFTAKVSFSIGVVQSQRGKFQDALTHSLDALSFFRSRKDSARLVSIYNTLGGAYKEVGLYDLSLQYYLEMLKHMKETNPMNLGRAYNNISNLYFSIDENEKALEYSQRSLDLFLQNKDTSRIVYILNNMSGIFPAEEAQRAIDTLNRALEMVENHPEPDPSLLSMVYYNLSYQHTRLEKPNEAARYLRMSKKAYEKSQFRYLPPQFFLEEASIYQQKGQADSAVYSLKEAIRISSKQNMRSYLLTAYQQLSSLYKEQERSDSALRYLELGNALRDSMELQEKEDYKAGLQIENEFRQKQALMEQIEENNRNQIRNEKMRYWFSVGGLLAVIIGLLFYIRALRRKKNN
jgi:tetratricopeptide (TPR) repeat protein